MRWSASWRKKILIRRGGFLLQLAILITWVVMMALLVQKTLLKPEALKITPALAKERMKIGEDWWGVYWKGEKIGYAVTGQEQQEEKISVQERAWLKLSVLGIPQNIEQILEYRVNQRLTLDSFDFSLKSGLVQFRLAGRMEDLPSHPGKRLRLVVHSGGREHQQEISLKEAPHILGQTKLHLLSQGLEVGKKYSIPAFDPATLSTAEVIAEVEGVERLNIGGEERELYRIGQEFRGIMTKSWMDRKGDIWKEESPIGLVLLRESKNVALHKNWNPGKTVDLIALTAIPVKQEIPNPRSTQYLRARLHLPTLKGLKIEGERQSRNGNEVVIRKETFPPKIFAIKPLKEEERFRALQATPFIQSDDPKIKRQAEAIVDGAKDPAEKVSRIAAWLFREVEKRPVVSIPSAVEVLRQKVGDCNEHAVLFTALARAVGIPAHMQAGVIYQEGKFYYHAWAQVYLGTWVAVDPLLNQIPADATHIRLVEGDLDKQLDIVRVIGRLQVEVLEVH
ncbi:MAG: transglutaminase-like domain-containing protein [Proteobacteria bacterium]|nr:transglutaminase-like domain-containing protein [Pseudomonadota bacterium]